MPVVIKNSSKSEGGVKTKSAPIPANDAVPFPLTTFESIGCKVENIKTEHDALSLMKLVDKVDLKARFLKGCILLRVKEHGLHAPYSFSEWHETHFGFRPRQAQFYMRVSSFLSNTKLAFEDYDRLSWTAWRILSSHIQPGEAGEWMAKAENWTTAELLAALGNSSGSHSKAEEPDVQSADNPANIVKFTCTVQNDDFESIELAISECKSATNWVSEGKCLAGICQEYLSGSPTPGQTKVTTIKDLCGREIKKHHGNKQAALDSVCEQVLSAFPEWTLSAHSEAD